MPYYFSTFCRLAEFGKVTLLYSPHTALGGGVTHIASFSCELGQGYDFKDDLTHISEAQVLMPSWKAMPFVHVTPLHMASHHSVDYMVAGFQENKNRSSLTCMG